MPDPFTMLAGPAGSIVNAGLGLALGGIERKNQYKQQVKMQNLQIAGQKEMGDYNYGKQMQLWNETGYGAQMKQIKEAGLNPAMMYGMSGGGGQTAAAQPGTVSAGQAHEGNSAQMAGMGMQMGMQMALLKAQKENIEADTAAKLAGVPKTGEEVKNIAQDTSNKAIQGEILKLEQQLKGKTLENQASIVNMTLSKLIEETAIEGNKRKVSDATVNDDINRIKAEALGATLENNLTEQLTTESKAKIQKMAGDLINASRGLDIEQQRVEIQRWVETVKANFPSIMNVLGRGLNDIIESIVTMKTGSVRQPAYEPPKQK